MSSLNSDNDNKIVTEITGKDDWVRWYQVYKEVSIHFAID